MYVGDVDVESSDEFILGYQGGLPPVRIAVSRENIPRGS